MGLRNLKRDRLKEVLQDFVPQEANGKALVSDSRLVTKYAKVLVNRDARKLLRETGDLSLAAQIVEEGDLPTRLTKVGQQLEILQKQLQRVRVTDALRRAAQEVFLVARAIRKLTMPAKD